MRTFAALLFVPLLGCIGPFAKKTEPDAGAPPAGDAGVAPPAVDAGAPPLVDAGVEPCGALTNFGACDGDVLRYCADEGIVDRIDCAQAGATCALIDGTYGYDCARRPGEPCLTEQNETLFCTGASPGCFFDRAADGYVCQSGLFTCDPSQVGTCVGDRLVEVCTVGQPAGLDCADIGGRCDGTRCLSREGGLCDGTRAVCEVGTACVDGVCEREVVPPTLPPGWAFVTGVDPRYGNFDAEFTNGDVVELSNGALALGGRFSGTLSLGGQSATTPGADDNPYLAWFSSDGAPQGLVHLVGSAGRPSRMRRIASDRRGGLWGSADYAGTLTVGNQTLDSGGQVWSALLRYDGQASLQGGRTLDGASTTRVEVAGLAATSNRVIAAGDVSGPFDPPYLDPFAVGFVIAFAPDGTRQWHHQVNFGGFSNPASRDVAVDTAGNVYWLGEFSGTQTFAPGRTITSRGGTDIFVAKFSAAGALQWVYTGGGRGEEEAHSLTVDSGGRVYVSGQFRDEFIADPEQARLVLTGSVGGFVLGLSASGAPRWVWEPVGQRAGTVTAVSARGNAVCATGYFWTTGNASVRLGGVSLPGIGTSDAGFVVRLDTNGNVTAADRLFGADESVSHGVTVAATRDDGCVVYGFLGEDFDDPSRPAGGVLMKYRP